jgi:hypothetical protein
MLCGILTVIVFIIVLLVNASNKEAIIPEEEVVE